MGQVSKEDIENEARVVSSLMKIGGHENIITIITHDWLPLSSYYYIDMELCDLTLHDYINYLAKRKPAPFEISSKISPVFVTVDPPVSMRVYNMWTVGSHIARGLEFMHEQDHVHRDLTPRNGTIDRVQY